MLVNNYYCKILLLLLQNNIIIAKNNYIIIIDTFDSLTLATDNMLQAGIHSLGFTNASRSFRRWII